MRRTLLYWESVEASVNGMMGGFESLSNIEEQSSVEFITKNVSEENRKLVLDCGAGIGRVSKNVLLKIFDKVTLLEPTVKLIDKAKEMLPTDRVLHFHVNPIQNMEPKPDEIGSYDLVWFQWVLCYADDAELVNVLSVTKKYLNQNGIIGVKENISSNSENIYDSVDDSTIRTDSKFKQIFHECGLVVISSCKQAGFPKELYPVKMYMLKPNK